jgi:hypothetical protein
MLIEVSIATSVAVGDDALANHQERIASFDRIVTGVALCGGAAAADTKVELFAGTARLGEIFNTTTGFPTADHDRRVLFRIPRGIPLVAKISDVPNTNAAYLRITGLP